jgi:RNA polymerase sigma factor (sigma-70 family)
MTFLRKRRLDTSSIDDEGTFIQLENQSGAMNNNLAERKSQSYYIDQAIEQLLPDDAMIITLFYKGEQSLEEIGEVMGLEVNNVKVKLFRARQRLKEKLERNLKQEVNELI